jgi:hypothetical protein
MSAVPQASAILASLGQAAFVWDIATDAIAWSDHAAAVFPISRRRRWRAARIFAN